MDYPKVLSGAHSGRGRHTVDLVVLHYTAGIGNESDAAQFFAREGSEQSAHFVIGRGGGVIQCVELWRSAWHAGSPSSFRGHAPVGPRSIGIELCNRGWAYKGPAPYVGRHANPGSKSTMWEPYPAPQLDALEKLLVELRGEVPTLEFVTGHEDIRNRYVVGTAGSKLDPGPAFPWGGLGLAGLERWRYDYGAKVWAR